MTVQAREHVCTARCKPFQGRPAPRPYPSRASRDPDPDPADAQWDADFLAALPTPIEMHWPSGHFVYLAYAEGGGLLYVGATSNLIERLARHQKVAEWYQYARAWRLIPCPTRSEAFRVEARLRAYYSPPWNVL